MSWATDAGSNASNDWKWIVDCAPCGLARMTTENHVWVFVLIHSQETLEGNVQVNHLLLRCFSTKLGTRAIYRTAKWVQNVDERAEGYDFQHG
jgi:hypothetical protein